MTFSILARDATGAIGMAVSSSSIAVAARCIHLRAQVGGVASQNITDPRFGDLLLNAMAEGLTPDAALQRLVLSDETIAYRQIMVINLRGQTSAYSGTHTLGVHNVVAGEGVVVGGNLLANESVPQSMLDAYAKTPGDLEIRLMAALEAGEAAGGEAGEVRSCGLAVVRDVAWRVTDLRVDWHQRPIAALREALEVWLPEREAYVARGIDPKSSPSYGVPGDE